MVTFSALLALCAGNSPVIGEFPAQTPVTRSFDVFFDLCLYKRLRKQSWGWRVGIPSRSLWRNCDGHYVCGGPSTCQCQAILKRNADETARHVFNEIPLASGESKSIFWLDDVIQLGSLYLTKTFDPSSDGKSLSPDGGRNGPAMGLLPNTSNCGCACAGNAGNVFPATAGKQSRHASQHVRDACAVMHTGIANLRFPLNSEAGENVPGIPAHAQPAMLRIW